MTDLGLQDAIVVELKDSLDHIDYKMPWAGSLEKINVYSQELPIKDSGQGIRDEDGDTNDQWNFVCVVLSDEDMDGDRLKVEVHFSIGIKDFDKNCQGHRYVANLMNAIWLHFLKRGIIAERYRMQDDEYHKRFQEEFEYPYYQGDLITYWELMCPQMEGLEELI